MTKSRLDRREYSVDKVIDVFGQRNDKTNFLL